MRNIFSTASFFCLLLLIFSCAKKTEHLDVSAGVSMMKAKVDGKLVECSTSLVTFYEVGTKKTIQIVGNKGTEGFSITINDYKGVGSYDLSKDGIAVYLGNSTDAQATNYMADQGTLKITLSTEKMVTGTFEFTASNTAGTSEKKITEGSFSISLEVPKGPTPTPGNGNMSAKINGTATSFTGQATFVKSTAIGNFMQIIGMNGSKAITLSIADYKGTGIYLINDQTDHQGGYVPNNAGTESFGSKTGKIIVTSATSNSIKGTFEFEAPNDNFQINTKVSVTEGKFEMSYTTQTF